MSVELSKDEMRAWKRLQSEGVSWDEFVEVLPKLRVEAKQRKESLQKILEEYEIRKGNLPRKKEKTVTEQDLLKKRMDILEQKERVIAGFEEELKKLQSQTDEWEQKTGIDFEKEFKKGLNILRHSERDNFFVLFNKSPHTMILESINDENFNIMLKPYEFKKLETKKHWTEDEKMRINSLTIFSSEDESEDEDEPTENGGD